MATFAEGIENYEGFKYWMIKSPEIAERCGGLRDFKKTASFKLIPCLVQENRFDDALKTAFDFNPSQLRAKRNALLEPIKERVKRAVDESENRNIEKGSCLVGIVPSLFQLCNLILDGNAFSMNYIEQVIKICRSFNNELPTDNIWGKVAMYMEDVFILKRNFIETIKDGTEIAKTEGSIPHLIYYIGMAVRDDALPHHVIRCHMAVYPMIDSDMKRLPYMFRNIIAPYFVKYWKSAFENMRFRFSNSSDLEVSLNEVYQLPYKSVVPKLLYIIAQNIVPEEKDMISQIKKLIDD